MKKLVLVGAVGAAFVLTGCSGGGGLGPNQANPRIRAMNATGNVVDATVSDRNGTTVLLNDQPAGTLTPNYAIVENGNNTLTFRNANDQTIIATGLRLMELNKSYTAVVYGLNKMALLTNVGNPAPGNAAVQFFHAGNTPQTIDVYITEPNETIAGKQPTFNNIVAEQLAGEGFIGLPAGQKRIRVTPGDSQVELVDTGLGMVVGGSYLIIFARTPNARLMTAAD